MITELADHTYAVAPEPARTTRRLPPDRTVAASRSAGLFGEIQAELGTSGPKDEDRFEVFAPTHLLRMRYDGHTAGCELLWSDDGRRQRLAEVRQGSILFNPARRRVIVRKREPRPYRYVSLHIPPAAFAAVSDDGEEGVRPEPQPHAGMAQTELSRLLVAIAQEITSPGQASALYKEILALHVLIQLIRFGPRLTVTQVCGGLAAWQLRRTTELIEADLSETQSIRQLAAHVSLSPAHFCTAFKQSTGISPHQYLLRRRVARAKVRLADRRASLTEIALECGFGGSSQFATTFRRMTGTTPSAYRRDV